MTSETHEALGADRTVRVASRLVILDDTDRILLFRATNAEIDDTFWFTPGGGLEPGETHEEAAHRELWEETGLTNVELGPWIWSREGNYLELHFREKYFLIRTPNFEPQPAQPDPRFEQYMLEDGWFRWWTADELATYTGAERIEPPGLARLLPPILEGDLPAEPLDLR